MPKIKILADVGSDKQTYSEIEIEAPVSKSVKKKINQEVGEFIVEQVLSTTADSSSPVAGESWPALSPDYKKYKKKLGQPGKPDMELTGELKDELTFKQADGKIKVGFFGDQAAKADGHLKFSGRDGTAPRRRFLPGEGQRFTDKIESGIEQIIADNIVEDGLDKSDLEGIETKSELYRVLSERFEGLTKAEIKTAILGTPDLVDLFDSMDLLELL